MWLPFCRRIRVFLPLALHLFLILLAVLLPAAWSAWTFPASFILAGRMWRLWTTVVTEVTAAWRRRWRTEFIFYQLIFHFSDCSILSVWLALLGQPLLCLVMAIIHRCLVSACAFCSLCDHDAAQFGSAGGPTRAADTAVRRVTSLKIYHWVVMLMLYVWYLNLYAPWSLVVAWWTSGILAGAAAVRLPGSIRGLPGTAGTTRDTGTAVVGRRPCSPSPIGSLVAMGGHWRIGVTAAVLSRSINSLFCRCHCCFTTTVTTFEKEKKQQVSSVTSYS